MQTGQAAHPYKLLFHSKLKWSITNKTFFFGIISVKKWLRYRCFCTQTVAFRAFYEPKMLFTNRAVIFTNRTWFLLTRHSFFYQISDNFRDFYETGPCLNFYCPVRKKHGPVKKKYITLFVTKNMKTSDSKREVIYWNSHW